MTGDDTDTQVAGNGGRRGDIQGLRAVAVLLVVIYHADLGFSGGFVGVDVFFVISGYVITRALTAELGRTDRISLGRFYLRRIRRLLPALGLMLTVVMLASSLLAPIGGQQITARTGGAAALFNANNYLIRSGEAGYFDVDADLNALLHTWSLSVEEQFYFVFPAVLYAAWVLGRRVTRIGTQATVASALALISIVSFVSCWMLTNGRVGFLGVDAVIDRSNEIAFYSSLTRAWEFAVGGLLVLASRRLSKLTRGSEWLLVTLGMGLVGYSAVRFDELTLFPGAAALVPVVGTLCLLAAGEGRPENFVSKGLAVWPAQFLGDLSYSWYLWHWPFIVFAAALWPDAPQALVLAAATSIVPAWLSYRLVEQPIRFSPGTTRRTMSIASACVLAPLAATVTLIGINSIVVAESTVELRWHADSQRGCDDAIPAPANPEQGCIWAVDGASRTAVLIGDSNAGQFTEAFTGAANDQGLNARVTTRSDCPFVDLIVMTNGEKDDDCRSFVDQSLLELVQNRPDLVIMASRSSFYIEAGFLSFEDPLAGTSAQTHESKALLWTEGLTRTIERLTDAGIEVIVVNVVPTIPNFDSRECAALRQLTDLDACAPSVDFDAADQDRQRAVQAEVAAAARAGATTVDVAQELCPNGTCSARRDGIWVWLDEGHISVEASVRLIPTFSTLF